MNFYALLIASALLATTASARLGWTKAQMLEKFKDPSVNHIEHTYTIDENNKVKALFDNDIQIITASSGKPGKDWIEYRRADGQVLAYQCTSPAKLASTAVRAFAVAMLERSG